MANIVSTLRRYLRISRADEIARRYLIMNGFDGALTTLGVVLGGYIAGGAEAKVILAVGLGASLAMAISGAWGAYMAEKAERTRGLRELEEALFTKLDDTLIDRASRAAMIFVALVDALSPIAAAVITLTPFALVVYGLMTMQVAIYLSIGLNMGTLFILGAFLGRISKSNILLYGGLMVTAGLVTAFFVYLLKLIP